MTRAPKALVLAVAAAMVLAAAPAGSGGGSARGPVPSTTTSTTVPTPEWHPRLRGKDIEVLPVSKKIVALTFDAGANADGARSIPATLAEADVPATFFLKGGFCRGVSLDLDTYRHASSGYNHTMTHVDLTTLTRAEIRARAARRSAPSRRPRPRTRGASSGS